jgi:hypothetical protein
MDTPKPPKRKDPRKKLRFQALSKTGNAATLTDNTLTISDDDTSQDTEDKPQVCMDTCLPREALMGFPTSESDSDYLPTPVKRAYQRSNTPGRNILNTFYYLCDFCMASGRLSLYGYVVCR